MKLVTMFVSATFLVSQSGCSFFASSMVPLTVICSEKDADLFIDGQPIGKGTVSTLVSRDSNHIIMAKKGDRVGTVAIGTRLSGLGILDIIGGFLWLIPFLGLASPGSRSPDRDKVTVVIP